MQESIIRGTGARNGLRPKSGSGSAPWLAAAMLLALGGASLAGETPAMESESGTGPCALRTIELDPGDPRLRYTGRWDVAVGKAKVSWAGSGVVFRFRGSSARVHLDPGGAAEQFRVAVNGEAMDDVLVAAPGRTTHALVENLDPGRSHTIEVMKETYQARQTTLFGFQLQGCEVRSAPPAPPRRIAFFGDSNMDGTSLYDEKDGGDSGTWFAYPATVGRMLDAEISLQAFGGATLTEQPDNSVMAFITAPARDRSEPGYRDSFDPQVIVVNAGANDIFRVTGPDQKTRIKDRFHAVIDKLRTVYGPSPHIILYNAYGWHLDEPAGYTQEVVDEVGGNVSAVHYPWIWEQFHGAMAEHGGQARFLAEAIADLDLGFEIVRPVGHIDGWGRNFDVANGGFEESGRSHFNGFGWRYADDGVERLRDPEGAFEGAHHIRLEAGEQVHQGTDATGDFLPGPTGAGQRYEITAWARAVGDAAVAALQADFEGQAMYGRGGAVSRAFEVGPRWTRIQATFTAPPGTWKTFVTLAARQGTVDFDQVSMRDPDG